MAVDRCSAPNGFLKPTNPGHCAASPKQPSVPVQLLLPFADANDGGARPSSLRAAAGPSPLPPGAAPALVARCARAKLRLASELAVGTAPGSGCRSGAATALAVCRGSDLRAAQQGQGYDQARVGSPASTSCGTEGDPSLLLFPEEPEDPRVYVPAHRMGDLAPTCAGGSPAKLGRAGNQAALCGTSLRRATFGRSPGVRSSPELLIAAKQAPLGQPTKGHTMQWRREGNLHRQRINLTLHRSAPADP